MEAPQEQSATSAMSLALNSDEVEIVSAVADFLDHAIPLQRLHSPENADLDQSTRRELGNMGWLGLAAPEEMGGSGLSAVEHALFFREVGRRCGPVDILAQCLAVLVAAGDRSLCESLLSGERGVTLAVREGNNLRLFGSPASALALHVEREGASLLDLSGLDMEACSPLDPATTMRVAVGDVAPAIARSTNGLVWVMGQLGTAAMLVGIAEAALDLIVEYAKIRETFGRKIGSYQAVRHPCAEMALRVEASRCQLWYAAASMKVGRGDAEAQLDAAKHLANQAAVANADVNIQLHGGIGVTDEHHAHLLLKRAQLLSRIFGTKRVLLERLLHASVQD